jgi:tetratricopeptide (TPR) repeat protein
MTPVRNVRWLAILLLASLSAFEPAQSQEAASKAAPLAPSLPRTPAERDSVLADLYDKLAAAADETKARALEESIERVWLHSGSPTIDLLFGRAMQAVAEKDFDRALLFLDHVVEQAPDFTEGWSRRAFVHFQRNEVGLALGDLRRALALDPSNFKALDGLAQVLRDIGEKRAALAVLRRLFEVNPHWPGAEKAIEELGREVEGQPL